MDAGATDYLIKPIRLEGLNAALSRILDSATTIPATTSTDIRRHDVPIDTRYLIEELGEDPGQLRSTLRLFIDTNRATLSELSPAIGRRDWRQIEALTHRILGSARTAGAIQLCQALEALGEAAKAQDQSISARFTDVEQVFIATEQFVDNL